MADIDAWKAEEQLQSTLFAEAMQTAIETTAAALLAEGKPPMMNALAGAFVTVEAAFLAALSEAGLKALRDAMARQRPRALFEARAANPRRALIVKHGGRADG